MIMSLLQAWPKKVFEIFPFNRKKNTKTNKQKKTVGLGEKWQIQTSYHSYKHMSSITQVTV